MAKNENQLDDAEKMRAFLKGLTKLSTKYGLVIGGCGCCGSPFVSKREIKGKQQYAVNAAGDDLGLTDL